MLLHLPSNPNNLPEIDLLRQTVTRLQQENKTLRLQLRTTIRHRDQTHNQLRRLASSSPTPERGIHSA